MKSNTQNNNSDQRRPPRDRWKTMVFELVLFAMLGTIMFCSKFVMNALPNIHPVAMFTIAFTLVFRSKALIPLYVNIFLIGIVEGFGPWWLPYLYIWTILWAITMLIPKKTPRWLLCILCPFLCALHGLAFGILYSPAQALMFGLDFEETLAWIAMGIPYDLLHCAGNLVIGLLIVPLTELMKKL